MTNFTIDGTPADMATYRALRRSERQPPEVSEQVMRLAKYEVIIGQFEQIVNKQTEFEPDDERHSSIRY